MKLKNAKCVRSAIFFAFMLIMGVLLSVPAVSALDDYGDGVGYFNNIQLSKGADEMHLTNLPLAQNYELVTVNPSLFATDADSDKLAAVDILGKEYLLELEPVSAPVAEDAKYIVINESGTFTLDPPYIQCYKGTVAGEPESYAFFTVDNQVILGTIRMGNMSYTIDQVGTVEVGGKRRIVHAIYDDNSVIDIKEPLESGIEVIPRLEGNETIVHPSNEIMDPESVISSTTTVTFMGAHDQQFRDLFPSPNSEITDMIAQVNTAFSTSDIDVSLQISAYCDVGSTLSSYDSEDLLYEFKNENSAFRDSTNSDIAVLFTGRDLDGDTIGSSFRCMPDSDYGYAHVQMCSGAGSYQATFSHRNINTAHEIGHLFGAGHEDSTAPYPSYAKAYHWKEWFTYDRYTALWSHFMGNDMRLEYSCDTKNGDASHDNARRINEMKGYIAGYQ